MDELLRVKYLWQGGNLVELENAKVHILTPTFFWGTNVFEGIRGYWNKEKGELYLFRIDDHFQRLTESAKMMRIDLPYPPEQFFQYARDLITRNGFREDIHMVQVVYLDGIGHPRWFATSPTNMFLAAFPRGRTFDVENGVKATISSWKRTADNVVPPRIKCGSNYQNCRLAGLQAMLDGYDAVIMLNELGKVSEGTGYCIFMVRKNKLVTPPCTADLLESITSDTVIRICRDLLDLEVEQRDVDRTELYVAEEVFLCGSLAEITPVVSMDKIPIGMGYPGELTKKIQNAYFRITRGMDKRYASWTTPVYGNTER
ncbi:MAG TPA: branched-chain amino acid transaminase [Desulfatiglandales bacterium]|nr:branched-chain amino acid transaminase [Desulfatiglandales bacterium]